MYHNDELYHYGVKGMKWGVRRQQKKDQRSQKKAIDKVTYRETKVKKKLANGIMRAGALLAADVLASSGSAALSLALTTVSPSAALGLQIVNGFVRTGIMAGHYANIAYTPAAAIGNVVTTKIHNANVKKNLEKERN